MRHLSTQSGFAIFSIHRPFAFLRRPSPARDHFTCLSSLILPSIPSVVLFERCAISSSSSLCRTTVPPLCLRIITGAVSDARLSRALICVDTPLCLPLWYLDADALCSQLFGLSSTTSSGKMSPPNTRAQMSTGHRTLPSTRRLPRPSKRSTSQVSTRCKS